MNNSSVGGNICIAYRSIIYVQLQETCNQLESSRDVPWLCGSLSSRRWKKERNAQGSHKENQVSLRHSLIFQLLHLTASLPWRAGGDLQPIQTSEQQDLAEQLFPRGVKAMKREPEVCQKVGLLCLGDVGLQGNPTRSCSFKEGVPSSQCYPTPSLCPHQQVPLQVLFQGSAVGRANIRAETSVEAFCLPLPVPTGISGKEKEDQAPFLALALNLAGPDFVMSGIERQFIFIAQCFEFLGLKVE